jgi:drug/metabolite transporter (DMT)-like permease
VLPASDHSAGLLLGVGGILVFSFTLPATKLALRGLDPWFIAFGRAAVAGALAAVVLRRRRAAWPSRRQWAGLAAVAGGVVIGFPVLSTLALQSNGAAHSAVVIALLPAVTALIGALRAGESPGLRFWLAAGLGAAVVSGYALAHSAATAGPGDLYLIGAVVVCAIGYAEGAVLSRELGAPQTICWALVMAWPLTVPGALLAAPTHLPSGQAFSGFAYVSVASQFLGFFAWYAGLARGGVARVSQVQLAQSPLTLAWSALVLGEPIGSGTVLVALAVLASVAATQRARVSVGARATGRQLEATSSAAPVSAHSGSISSA